MGRKSLVGGEDEDVGPRVGLCGGGERRRRTARSSAFCRRRARRALVDPETGGVSLIAFATEAGSIGESNMTAIWLWTLTPATFGDGMSLVTRSPTSTVLKLVA